MGKSSNESESTGEDRTAKPPQAKNRKWWQRLLLGTSGIMLVSLGGGLGYGWYWLQRELTPLVERELTNLLNRPINVGQLETISPTGGRLGKSEIPATQVDPDRATVEAVEVEFNLLNFLRWRQLELSVTLINPELYLEQDRQGTWLSTKLDRREDKDRAIQVELQAIRIKNADVLLVSRAADGKLKQPVKALVPSGAAKIDNDRVAFDLAGQLLAGGRFQAEGTLNTDNNNIDVVLSSNRVDAVEVGNLVLLPFNLQAGQINSELEILLRQGKIASLGGVATLRNVTAKLPTLPQAFRQVQGQLRFEKDRVRLDNVKGLFGTIAGVANGTASREGDYLNIEAQTSPFRVAQAVDALKLEKPTVTLTAELKTQINVTGTAEQPKVLFDLATIKTGQVDRVTFKTATARAELVGNNIFIKQFRAIPTVGGRLGGNGQLEWRSGKFEARVQATQIPAQILRPYNPNVPTATGPISGQAKLLGNLAQLNWQKLRAQGSANFTLAGGIVNADALRLAEGRWQSEVRTSGVQLQQLDDKNRLPPQWQQGRLEGVFAVSGGVESLLPTLQASGRANIQVANGLVVASNLTLANGTWQTDVQAQQLELEQLFPDAPTPGLLFGRFNLAGNINNLTLEGIQARGTGRLLIEAGTLEATKVRLEAGNFVATVLPNLQLEQLGVQETTLKGRLSGELAITGNASRFSPADIQARGQLNFSQGLAVVEQPLRTVLRWNGQRLDIKEATAQGLSASGFITVNPSFFSATARLSAIDYYRLNVDAQGLAIAELPLALPQQATRLDYSGKLDFEGVIAGTPETPEVNGEIALRDFTLASLAFESILTGTLETQPETGIHLQLAGTTDRIEVALSPDYQPEEFLIQFKADAGSLSTLEGSRRGNLLQINAQAIPVGLLKDLAIAVTPSLPKSVTTTPVSGRLSGEAVVDLNTLAAEGNNLTVVDPVIGRLNGERLEGNLRYANNQFILTDGLFQQRQSQYFLNGNLKQTPEGPQFQARAEVSQGQIQDVLETLEIFELSDLGRGLRKPNYANAAALYPQNANERPPEPLFSVGIPRATVLDQLRRLSEVETRLAIEQQRRDASPLPELAKLEGTFSGQVTTSGSPESGIEAEFGFQGQHWQWDSYTVNQVIAQGSLQNGILTVLPISLQSDNSSFIFSGSFGGETQSGQLRLVDVPVALVQDFVTLPPAIGFGGQVNATVAIAGSRDNPQARGELTVEDATINQTSVQSTQGSFSYNNARLNFFASSVIAEGSEPLTAIGSFPYSLPVSTVKPDNDQLSLSLNVQNEGLALLNILTRDELAWIGGTGEVNLDIFGTFRQNRLSGLKAEGVARLENAAIAARIISEAPLTGVGGTLLFNLDRLEVENFRGNIGGGELQIEGTLPLTQKSAGGSSGSRFEQAQATPQDNPLTVFLRNVAIDIKGLYGGGVQGAIQIAGSAFEPEISGEVELFEGEIQLGEAMTEGTPMEDSDEGLVAATTFNDLQLRLGERIRIARPPLLSFLATGSLAVNGTLNNPRPQGTIQLQRGQVNLFTTQFQLAGGEENTAQFFPNRGLDPYLDVSLVTSVLETTSEPTRRDPLSADVRENLSFRSTTLETVRVQAEVQGFASQLTDSVELTSSPPRSETEIVSLLGGGFVNTLGRGDTTLGLANLAGSAFFGSFQGAISEALGLSELRIFPTTIVNENEEERTTTFGLAAEAGVDISDRLSFSVLKILTTEQPAQYGVRYRLNEQTTLRGSTDFSSDSRATIEFEQRF